MVAISRAQFLEITQALVKGRQKFPRKGVGSVYERLDKTGYPNDKGVPYACAVGAIAAGLGRDIARSNASNIYEWLDNKYGDRFSSFVFNANDTAPSGCDPDLAVIAKLRSVTV